MKNEIEFPYVWTEDNLLLPGVHYPAFQKKTCVLSVHGMADNFMTSYFAHVLGEKLAAQEIGFLYGHNRGAGYINDVTQRAADGRQTTIQIGTTYERFPDCRFDLRAWLQEAQRMGYQKVILFGHSLGCNKILYFCQQEGNIPALQGIVLASPPDMVGLTNLLPNCAALLSEALQDLCLGHPRKLLSAIIWESYYLSAQTFCDLAEIGGAVDNLPIFGFSHDFTGLAQIEVPLLGIMGEFDDIICQSPAEDLAFLAQQARRCPNFTPKIIPGANHVYATQEMVLADCVVEWVNQII